MLVFLYSENLYLNIIFLKGMRVGVAPIIETIVETRFRCFGHVERKFVDSEVRIVDQMKGSKIARGIGIPRKL
jgi:hypothetical protein